MSCLNAGAANELSFQPDGLKNIMKTSTSIRLWFVQKTEHLPRRSMQIQY